MITLPPERTKNRREHLIPLAPAVVAILQAQPRRFNSDGSPRDLVFGHGARGWQDWSGSKADLDARIQAAESIAELAAARFPKIDEHHHARDDSASCRTSSRLPRPRRRAPLRCERRLQRGRYLDLRRVALEKWADHVVTLATGERPPTVVTLRGRRPGQKL